MRLVLQADRGEDPWIHDGPWKQTSSSNTPMLQVNLVPGHFVDAEGSALPILQSPLRPSAWLSWLPDELAGIVISD